MDGVKVALGPFRNCLPGTELLQSPFRTEYRHGITFSAISTIPAASSLISPKLSPIPEALSRSLRRSAAAQSPMRQCRSLRDSINNNHMRPCVQRLEWVESPGTFITEWVSRGHFSSTMFYFGLLFHALVVITWTRVGCRYMIQLG